MTDSNHTPDDSHGVLDQETQSANPDPRHQKRIRLMQALFSHSFEQEIDLTTDELKTYQQIVAQIDDLDPQIQAHAPERPLADINQVDLAILRLSVFEATQTKVPTKVIINEAVELAKEFGTDSSPKFVNGVLGQLLAKDKTNEKEPAKES